MGGGVVGAALFRQALTVVDAGAVRPSWDVPGRVWSGPLELWPGLEASPEEIAADLAGAGYTRVSRATQPGDLQVGPDALIVVPRKASGPGWEVGGGPVLLGFGGGRISSVTPKGARFPPALMATVRGEDNENRSPVPAERIPQHVRDAVVAMEDGRFYEHFGLDPIGLGRAVVRNLQAGATVQGGSSITQQLAKNLFLSQERTWERKYKEVFLALALEHRLDKEQILHRYLNEVYLGQVAGSSVHGVDAAARGYFGKPVERLSLGEAATLAGIISSPNAYSPVKHPDRAEERRDLALARMAELGFISLSQRDHAREEALGVHPGVAGRRAPWAVDLAIDAVEGEDDGLVAQKGLELHTAIQPPLQRLAEEAVTEGVAELGRKHKGLAGVQMALVAVRARDGAIVAMVGSRDYAESPFNRAASAERRIGSTVKPLTLLVALESDPSLSLATRLDDAPISRSSDGKTWTPSNYDGAFVGPISIRKAIASSRNIPAVLLAERVGMEKLRDRLRGLGLAEASHYPSAALGGFGATPLQLAGAYAVFASGGAWHQPWLLRGVRTPDGETVLDAAPEKASLRYSARATWLTRDAMRSVLTEGTGKAAASYGVGPGAAGKTGTTDDYLDAWFAGVSGPYAVVVWVGFDKGKKLGLTGGEAALPTWARFVAASGTSMTEAGPPAGLVKAEVCEATGAPPCPGCEETREEWFAEGQVPPRECGILPQAADSVRAGLEALGELFRGKSE